MTDEKTVCVIYYTDIRFKNMAWSAAKSFKKHHPDIDLCLFDSYSYMTAFGGIFPGRVISDYPPGVSKFVLAQWTAICGDYKKVIVLGADTITCARLDEFLDDDESDVIATLDFNYPLSMPGIYLDTEKRRVESFISPIALKDKNNIKRILNINPILKSIIDIEGTVCHNAAAQEDNLYQVFSNTNSYEFQFIHLNADVICFNNVEFLKYVIDFTTQNIQAQQRYENNIPPGFVNQYYEQGSLNFCTFAGWSGRIDDITTIGREKLCFDSKDMKHPKVSIPELYDENIIYNIRSQQSQKNVWKQHENKDLSVDFSFDSSVSKKDINFIKQYYVEDDKLYTSEGKQIKVWHYCDDFGGQKLENFVKLEQKWINTFNEETRNFFSNNCDCGDYFK